MGPMANALLTSVLWTTPPFTRQPLQQTTCERGALGLGRLFPLRAGLRGEWDDDEFLWFLDLKRNGLVSSFQDLVVARESRIHSRC